MDACPPGPIPTGDYAYEVKWDGFRAIVARVDGFRVVSRRGWEMTKLLPDLADLPAGCVFDGEIVAFEDGRPHFPLVCDRLLHGSTQIPLTYVIFVRAHGRRRADDGDALPRAAGAPRRAGAWS
jgi:ATP-dependent DNA ligase